MTMIRDFVYTFDSKPVIDLLKRFEIEVPNEHGYIAVVKFEIISPDSFMWRILMVNDAIYYLYAEDYVPGIEHIHNVFDQYIGKDKWEFIPTNEKRTAEETTAVASSVVYKESDNSDLMMKYAVDSGYDLVFLAKSIEDSKEALFSDHAPLGFTPKY